MMSSCWTFRLNRRKAFSRGSPSCNLTSAKYDDTPQLPRLDRLEFCSLPFSSQGLSGRKNRSLRGILPPILSKNVLISDRQGVRALRGATNGVVGHRMSERSASPSVQLGGVVMQDHMGQLQGAFPVDLSILHHSGKSDCQGFAT